MSTGSMRKLGTEVVMKSGVSGGSKTLSVGGDGSIGGGRGSEDESGSSGAPEQRGESRPSDDATSQEPRVSETGEPDGVGDPEAQEAPTEVMKAVEPSDNSGDTPGSEADTVATPVVDQPKTGHASTEVSSAGTSTAGTSTSTDGQSVSEKPPWVKVAVVAGAVVAVLAVLYTADILSSSGSVPRGVSVAGIEVGGKSSADAETTLQSELGARAQQPIGIDAGDRKLELVPAVAGLDVDWAATLDRAGSQPLNPITRLTSFFSDREIGVVSTVDPVALDGAVESVRAQVDREPIEGDVVFEGATPVPVIPAPGQSLDVPGAREAIVERWAFGSVEAPVQTVDVTVRQDEVDRVLTEVAAPAVSAPVVFEGRENTDAVLQPESVAQVLSFESNGEGALEPRYDTEAAIGVLAPQLAPTETRPQDASFAVGGGRPTVVPGVVGDLVQWPRTLEQLPALLASTDSRTTEAVYEPVPPQLTTEDAEALGVNEVIAEYTTSGFEYASGVNIRLIADLVNGALVEPGETFSLNEASGPRGYAQGFVDSGIIDNGRPDRAVGGGVSQFATTLYNAAYFAGMEDTEHTEHSYYISRYPEAREATVFEGAIDLKFTNPTDTGVVIESFGTSSDVTVRLWGTKTVDVESITGPRSDPTSPNTVTLPAGDECVASSGGPGFTARDTRVISDAETGSEISRNTRTVKYDPIPIVRCVAGADDPDDSSADE